VVPIHAPHAHRISGMAFMAWSPPRPHS
jgi:hypothetical protein